MADGTIYIDTAIDENSIEKEMKDTEKAIKRAEERLDKLIEKQIRFIETGGNKKSKTFQGMEYDIARASSSLSTLKTKYADMQNTMSAKKADILRGSFKKLDTTLGNVGKKVLGIGKSAKTSNRSMMKMLATSMLMGIAFMALMAVINGLKEGINNLAQYSGDANADLSALKSSLTQLKNSFATAFAPILSVVTPILTSFMNTISAVISKIGMLIAALSGKDTFTKAIAVQEDYAASLDKTADATKKVTDYSTSLDEINKASSNDSSKSSNGSASPSEMFEEVKIPNSFTNVADKIRKAFEPIIELISKGLGKAYENVLVPLGKWIIEEVGPLSVDVLKNSLELLTVTLEKLEPVINTLWKEVFEPFYKKMGEKITGLLEDFNDLLELTTAGISGDKETFFEILKKKISEIGKETDDTFLNLQTNTLDPFFTFFADIFVGDMLKKLDELGEEYGLFTTDVEEDSSLWKKALSGVVKFVKGSFTNDLSISTEGIKSMLNSLDELVQKVFEYDFTEALGIAGNGLNDFFGILKIIWDGIMLILIGIIDFLCGTFTLNWKQAWEGVKEIFKGVFGTLYSLVKVPINKIISLINNFINGFVNGFNSVIKAMNKLSVKIPDWVPEFGGKSFGINIKTMKAPQIPYLATGAVIPPNAPFMAVLGDQKHGTNIEAPLDTIKQAVAEVIGNTRGGGGTYTFIGQINRRTLFEEVIEEAKAHQLNTGNNPFELA